MTVRQLVARVLPSRRCRLASQGPVFTIARLHLAVADSPQGNICPRGEMKHDLPYAVGSGNRMLNRFVCLDSCEQLLQRRTMPRISANCSLYLVGCELAVGHGGHFFVRSDVRLRA